MIDCATHHPRQEPWLTRAVNVATRAHRGQTRKGLADPYIVHPMRVALQAAQIGLSDDALVAAVLHDVVEDCDVTLQDLRYFPARAVELVALLTKRHGPTDPPGVRAAAKLAYYADILVDREATQLKMIDRIDNLRDAARLLVIDPSHLAFVRRYLDKTTSEFKPFLLHPDMPVRLVLDFSDAYCTAKEEVGRLLSSALEDTVTQRAADGTI